MAAPAPVTTPPPGGPPASPTPRRTRRPRWLDLRLVVGVVLVVASVLLGATLFARAGRTSAVWALTRDLQSGAVLSAEDLRPADVRLPASGSYVAASEAVVGQRLQRAVSQGELLPRGALGSDRGADLLTVTIPFEPSDVPAVTRGDRITVWVSTRTCASVEVVDGVAVQAVSEPGGALASRDSVDVVVSVAPGVADRIVTALALDGATLRAGVRTGSAPGTGSGSSAADLPDLGTCGAVTTSPTPTAS